MLTPPNATSSAVAPNPLSMPKVPALDNTFGALLLGTYGGLILFGVTTHQAYRYFHMYPHDGRMLKGLVAVVMIMETVTVVLTVHFCYYNLVSNYFNPQALLYNVWSIDLFAVMSGVTMILSQSFFVRRIWLVAPRYKPVVVVAVILCIAEIGFLLAGSVKGFIIPTYAEYGNWQWLVSSGSTMAFTADTLLTVILIAVLRRSRTGIKRTDSMIDVMILYAVNTGLVTGIFNVLTMVFSFAQKKNLIWIGIGIIDARMYGVTLLAALNSRQSIAERGSGISDETSPFGISGISHPPRRPNTIGQGTGHRVRARQLRSGHPSHTGDHDASGSVIELKATHFGTTAGSTTTSSTVPFDLAKPAPIPTEFALDGVDGRMVGTDEKAPSV